MVVDPEHRVAAVDLAESFVVAAPAGGQGVDEDGHEALRCFDDSWVAERTAREFSTALSAGVLAEVDEHRQPLFAGGTQSVVVADVPHQVPDAHTR